MLDINKEAEPVLAEPALYSGLLLSNFLTNGCIERMFKLPVMLASSHVWVLAGSFVKFLELTLMGSKINKYIINDVTTGFQMLVFLN